MDFLSIENHQKSPKLPKSRARWRRINDLYTFFQNNFLSDENNIYQKLNSQNVWRDDFLVKRVVVNIWIWNDLSSDSVDIRSSLHFLRFFSFAAAAPRGRRGSAPRPRRRPSAGARPRGCARAGCRPFMTLVRVRGLGLAKLANFVICFVNVAANSRKLLIFETDFC